MTAKHTQYPTSWRVLAEKDDSSPDPENLDGYLIVFDETEEMTEVEVCHGISLEADAEFIVRACNSHDALLAACKWAARGEHHRACSHYRKNPNTCDCYVGACKTAIEQARESGE